MDRTVKRDRTFGYRREGMKCSTGPQVEIEPSQSL